MDRWSPSGSVYPRSKSLVFKEYNSPGVASGNEDFVPARTGALLAGIDEDLAILIDWETSRSPPLSSVYS